jgi:Tfp pilus assembly protein FimT
MPSILAARRGFTLVEAVATMVIISTLGSVAVAIIARASDAYAVASSGAQLQSELGTGIDRVERAMRAIRRKTGVAAADISGATASSLSWNAAGGACSLSVSGGQLLLALDGGGGVAILNDVTSLEVACYDEDGSALGAPLSGSGCEAIRRITVTVALSRHGSTATLRTGIFLRATTTGAG